MRMAAESDFHGNPKAFAAVVADIHRLHADNRPMAAETRSGLRIQEESRDWRGPREVSEKEGIMTLP